MGSLREIKTPPVERAERIVKLLEDLLEQAKRGDVTGLFIFSENKGGTVTHARDGMPDATTVFWLQLVQRRILEAYE